jgi:formylglycine-generating enzyme required for sulfatase activity
MRNPVFVCLALGIGVAAWSACAAAETGAEKIDRLIRQLGSEDFKEREAASKGLAAIGLPVLDALRKAANESGDPEVRRRARQLADAITTQSWLDCTGDGLSPATVRKSQEVWAKYLGRKVEETVEVADGVKMTFVLVPPGLFHMGSPSEEKDREYGERQHEVKLTDPFDLGKTEVTQAQYRALGLENPSKFRGEDRPVETVSWTEVRDWAAKLTKKRGDGHLYRLPTEAEWEYACRGGRPTGQPFGIGNGHAISSREANFLGKYPYGGAGEGPSLGATCRVARYAANALGLHDMHGNVWEWCADWHGPYADGAGTNPTGPSEEGPNRVNRGGSWSCGAGDCRAAVRNANLPWVQHDNLGFRLARRLPPRVH